MDKKLFPDGVSMMDPSKLTNAHAKVFVTLWQKVPFEFKAFQDRDGMHPAIYKNREKPPPRPKKHTRFVDNVDGQQGKRKLKRPTQSTTQEPESDGYDSDKESALESDSDSTPHSESDNPVVKATSFNPSNNSDLSSDEGPATPTPMPRPNRSKTKPPPQTSTTAHSSGSAGEHVKSSKGRMAPTGSAGKHVKHSKGRLGLTGSAGDTQAADSGMTRAHPAIPDTGKPTGPDKNKVKGRRGKSTPDNSDGATTLEDRAPLTDTFASISNPNPVTPRATRSMTGATPAKARPEVLLTRRAAPSAARPKPKPIGKGKGKSQDVQEDLEVIMKRTSKRTLAVAYESSPAKRRRT